MSALSRFGPVVARSMLAQQHRQMASASVATDPIQKLFVDKIREVKVANKGLDATHEKLLKDEMNRLKRVYSVEDESKLANLDHKFAPECEVSLRDLDTSKELREKIRTGEFQKQLAVAAEKPSAFLATMPDQTRHDMSLPPLNKPDNAYLIQNEGVPSPTQVGEFKPDYHIVNTNVTADTLEREMCVHFGENMPTIHDDGPQRDKVNFPRIKQNQNQPPTRYHIIPESWFQFFYPKTGVTGPYAFAATFGAFLFSKEWLVMEHELLTAFSSLGIFAYAIPKYGPAVRKYFEDKTREIDNGWDEWQQGNSKFLQQMIDHYKTQSKQGTELLDDINNVRKHDIDLQLDAEYRRRLKTIYEDTKKRLDYLVAVADSQRQIHHANLVNTVISNVMSSLGPKQEGEVLDNCIVNLKSLSNKHANAI